MTFDDVHRDEARGVGDPRDETISELIGIAPPCDSCGVSEAVARGSHGRDLCLECADDEARDQERGAEGGRS